MGLCFCKERRRANVLACLLFWSILSYLGMSRFVVSAVEVVGPSMLPTLHGGERFIINRVIYRLRAPRPGDIVALRLAGDDTLAVKRIIAGPLDRIEIRRGGVLVNGRRLSEPYLPPGCATRRGALPPGAYRVAPECYFVLGDNRGMSFDSRHVGAVPRRAIAGRILVRPR